MKQLDYYCNFILYNSINKILILFNKSIHCQIVYYFTLDFLIRNKDSFAINFNTLQKTKDKKIFEIIKQKVLFKYDYKRKTLQRN